MLRITAQHLTDCKSNYKAANCTAICAECAANACDVMSLGQAYRCWLNTCSMMAPHRLTGPCRLYNITDLWIQWQLASSRWGSFTHPFPLALVLKMCWGFAITPWALPAYWVNSSPKLILKLKYHVRAKSTWARQAPSQCSKCNRISHTGILRECPLQFSDIS